MLFTVGNRLGFFVLLVLGFVVSFAQASEAEQLQEYDDVDLRDVLSVKADALGKEALQSLRDALDLYKGSLGSTQDAVGMDKECAQFFLNVVSLVHDMEKDPDALLLKPYMDAKRDAVVDAQMRLVHVPPGSPNGEKKEPVQAMCIRPWDWD